MSDAYTPQPYSPFTAVDPIEVTDLTSAQPAPAPAPRQTVAQRAIGMFPTLPGLPAPIGRALSVGHVAAAPRVMSSLPNYATALSNKYSDPEIANAFATLDQKSRNGLVQLDAQRVAGGSPPLTKDETLRAIQTIVTQKPATPPSERSPLNLPGNILSDLNDIIRSIPRLPGAMISEVGKLGQMPDTPGNSLVDLLNAPGIRMVPGAYTAANVLSGGSGFKAAATHPLMTLLDVLPGASKLAAGTDVVRAAQTAADMSPLSTGGKVRPLGVLATRTLNDAGELVPNAFGQNLHIIRDQTRFGKALGSAFGKRERAVERFRSQQDNHIAAQIEGVIQDTPAAKLTAESAKLNARYATTYGWDEAQRARMTHLASLGDRSSWSSLAPEELAYINEADDLAHRYAQMMVNDAEGLASIIDPRTGKAEFYPSAKAAEMTKARALASHSSRMENLRRQYLSEAADLGAPLTSDTLAQLLDEASQAGSRQWVRREMRAVGQLMEAHGYDTTVLAKARNVAGRTGDWSGYKAAALNLLDDVVAEPRMPLADIITALRSHKQDVQANMLAEAIATNDTKAITKRLATLEDRAKFRLPIQDELAFRSTVRSWRRRYEFDNGVGRTFTAKYATRMADRAEKLLTRTPPARWEPRLIHDTAAAIPSRVEEMVGKSFTPDEAARVVEAVQNAHWNSVADLGADADMLRAIYDDTYREVAQTWRDLSAAGVDPVFVHNVSLQRARQMQKPMIGPVPNSLSQVRERASDFTPGVQDLGVALTHQGVELLTRAGSERFAEFVVDQWGVTQQQLQDTFAAQAQDMARANPELTARGHMQRLIDRSYEKFNPDQAGYSWGGARLDKYRGENVYFIPKSIAKNMKSMHDPGNALVAAMSPITKTFRIAVVGLSPRTQLYNILGGATMLLGETGPSSFRFFEQARKMVKNPATILNEELRATIGSMKAAQLDDGVLAVPRAQLLAGKTLGRMWQQTQESRALGKVKDAFGKTVEKSLSVNGFMDDVYRVMGYLYAKDKALTRGLAPEIAERAGMELTRKVMMDWTSLTPFERSTLKAIFPFYGFMNHAMRYVLRYPVDHPLRAEIVGAFGRTEAQDSKILPSSFLAALFFGGTSNTGQRNALNTAPVNPFGDVANMFTFAGFLSATNPVIGTILESVGLVRGEAELYPTLRYDPETGRLSATHGNPILKLLENTIPQTAVISSMLGLNSEFRDRMRRDPAAASRFLWSSAGMPLIWRSWSIPGEVAKAEIARGKAERSMRSEALQSGDWTQALRYPGLRDDYAKLLAATPQELAQYQPQGADIYAAMIEQALGNQQVQANANAQQAQQQTQQQLQAPILSALNGSPFALTNPGAGNGGG